MARDMKRHPFEIADHEPIAISEQMIEIGSAGAGVVRPAAGSNPSTLSMIAARPVCGSDTT